MRKVQISLTLLLVSLICASQAQEIIPFRLNNHYNILVKALINDSDSANLMFQIAMHEGSLAPNRINKVPSVKFDTAEFPEGLSKNNRIQVANTRLDSVWIWDNEYTGYEADGKIGTQLFKNKIFKINYDNSCFEVYDNLPSTQGFIALPLISKRGQLFIAANSILKNQVLTTEFMLQSGFSGAVIFGNTFTEQHSLENELTIIDEKTVLNSGGNKSKNLIALLPHLQIGRDEFHAIPVNISVGDLKNQPQSYIGADLIHRFNWIIDVKGKTAYLQKNKNFQDPYYFQGK
ncbi:hypothetical protein ACL9RF_02635 [Sphingobacterium sp. Mn56C]|uniref:hypothetical protein n=1 Tax=Sphingobacterium sp. Mn56C TaxID=3395261 RepID=UPI003BE7E909